MINSPLPMHPGKVLSEKLVTDKGLEGWGETAVLGSLYGLEDSYENRVKFFRLVGLGLRYSSTLSRYPYCSSLLAESRWEDIMWRHLLFNRSR